ncbi:MAG: ROK family protein [Acidobacteria bacterium]|nr:ROK family protein [Acidobacteriota bacterium]
MSYALGIDVGGAKIAASVADSDGKIHHKIKVPTGNAVAQIIEAAHQAVAAASVSWDVITAAGVAIPGIYYAETGQVWAPNIPGWDHIPLRAELEAKLPARVVVDSDRAAYVLGEQWKGIAQGFPDVVFVAVGTGIGAGIITGGKLCRGAGDIAGAIGWFAVDPRKKEIYKQTGCLEAEAAGPAVARRAADLAARVPSRMLEMAGGCLTTITAEMVVEAARQNDEAARQALDQTVAYLAMGLANLVSLLNPQMVVLGGGLMQAGDLLLEPLRREVLEWAQPIAARQVRLELTRLGEDAGLLGAARLALEDHVSG